MRKDDLTGLRFGKLTVRGDSGQRKWGSVVWDCQCDCGNSVLATRQQLVCGSVHDCGCGAKKRTGKVVDLTGMQVGELTVLRRAENDPYGHSRWLCRCSCGEETIVSAENLKKGRIRSCGCRQYSTFRGKDLAGHKFGRLTALYPVSRKNSVTSALWHCRCDCGCETDAYAAQLTSGAKQSCGCLKDELRPDIRDNLHYGNDTCLERLVRATNTTGENQSGFRGLYLTKNGTYRASITFRKNHYTLGYYRTFDEAVQARLAAEERLHDGYITAYAKYKERAAQDPEWAEENEFYYQVVRSGGEFQISTNGV